MEPRRLLSAVVVNSASDVDTAGSVTLRDAIAVADASATPTTITFDPGVFAAARTIALAGTELSLTNTRAATTIIGPAAGVTVSGGYASRVLLVDAGVTATVDQVTVTAGNSPAAPGGGIRNDGTLTFADGTVLSCVSGSGDHTSGGAGIFNDGTLNLTDVTLSSNLALYGPGGGLENSGPASGRAVATLSDVTMIYNTAVGGGGMASSGDNAVDYSDGTITQNYSYSDGGGLLLDGTAADTTLTGMTITLNLTDHHGGGIASLGGSVTVSESTIASNRAGNGDTRGGGIYSTGWLEVSDSTLTGNGTVYFGGGLGGALDAEGGLATLVNDTVAGNVAYSGGGVWAGSGAAVSLVNVTVAGNRAAGWSGVLAGAGGVATDVGSGASVNLGNSIVAGNLVGAGVPNPLTPDAPAPAQVPDVYGTIHSAGHNLIGVADDASGWRATDRTGTAAAPLAADLGPLTDNGGPTATMLPQAGSPVLGAGLVSLLRSGQVTDQRGDPRVVGSAVDVGAVELGVAPTPAPAMPVAVSRYALPASVITGAAVRGSVTLLVQNAASTAIAGPVAITLYATTNGTVDPSAISIATVTRTLSLKPGRLTKVTATAPRGVTLGAGTYTVVAQVTDVGGSVSVVSTGRSLTVAAAHAALAATVDRASSAAVRPGDRLTITVAVTNTGTATASGDASLAVYLSNSEVPVATVARPLTVKAGGKTASVKLTVNVPADMAAGRSSPKVVLALGGNTVSATAATPLTVG